MTHGHQASRVMPPPFSLRCVMKRPHVGRGEVSLLYEKVELF